MAARPSSLAHTTPTGPSGKKGTIIVHFTAIFRAAFPDVTVAIHDQFADGGVVTTRKSYGGTHSGPFMGIPGTGKHIDVSVIEIIRLRDGKYIDHWATADMLGLLQQIKGA